MRHIERADVAMPELVGLKITLAKMEDWKFGHITQRHTLECLVRMAKSCRGPVFEFGTFTGRTSFNIASNTDQMVYTIDAGESRFTDRNINRVSYPDYVPGEVFVGDPHGNIELIIGDSREVDLSRFYGNMGLVFVDGGHSYDAVKSDIENALRMITSEGVIVFDDYSSFWPEVKMAVDEMPDQDCLVALDFEQLVVYGKRFRAE